jgi:hypothetical protein
MKSSKKAPGFSKAGQIYNLFEQKIVAKASKKACAGLIAQT